MQDPMTAESITARRRAFYADDLDRLRKRDPSLWANDADTSEKVANRLGWLDFADWSQSRLKDVVEWAKSVKNDGYTDVVLLGMGGSSLAPEVCRDVFGFEQLAQTNPSAGHPRLHVLDNTHPGAIAMIESAINPQHSLFIVASKSGSTIETRCFAQYFFERMREQHGANVGKCFVAITDEGSDLQKLAASQNFSRTFINPTDIGGRYSALSYFGLVPAAACGVDIEAMVDRAAAFKSASDRATFDNGCPAVDLGVALGTLAAEGRDKLTLLASPSIQPLGVWIEQLVAESTGKQGVGILPVTGEVQRETYKSDRVFTVTRMQDDRDLATVAERLRQAGHPVFEWTIENFSDLGTEFFRWELATAVAGAVMNINPFDEPNVTESKNKTGELLERVLDGQQIDDGATDGELAGLSVYGAVDFAQTLKDWKQPGDYVALLAYGAIDTATATQLEQVRDTLGEKLGLPSTLGFGPRFLHSTGQLHKGGPGNGIFVQITSDAQSDINIPGESYSFGQLNACQALGDFEVLRDRERRVVRVHAGGDIGTAAQRIVDAMT